MKLLSNLPIENLTEENDYLGVIEKGDMIVSLLKSENIEFEQMKMFALYGNWGSGKSTLMKYMESKLQDDFKTFYFDAWQYENGQDLSFSLLEFLIDTGHSSLEKNCASLIEFGRKVLIGGLKGSNNIVRGVIEESQQEKTRSFHSQIQDFKKKFIEFEEILFQETKKSTNIVFIDDLDRCEPEKVLDLLSEIKLFFNFGERTIFFFGVDQKAVEVAIKTKYRDVVKSNEYLEKVFDLSFNMPSVVLIHRLTGQVFSDNTILQLNGRTTLNRLVSQLFVELGIYNPRKIKKVLNRYNMLLLANNNSKLVKHRGLIYLLKDEYSPLYIIYSLYLTILKMFSESEFRDFGSSSKKSQIIHDISFKSNSMEDNQIINSTHFDTFMKAVEKSISDPLDVIYERAKPNQQSLTPNILLYLSLPINLKRFNYQMLNDKESFEKIKVENDSFAYSFSKFLWTNILPYYQVNSDDKSKVTINELKIIIKQLG